MPSLAAGHQQAKLEATKAPKVDQHVPFLSLCLQALNLFILLEWLTLCPLSVLQVSAGEGESNCKEE